MLSCSILSSHFSVAILCFFILTKELEQNTELLEKVIPAVFLVGTTHLKTVQGKKKMSFIIILAVDEREDEVFL